ncbi:MULTISPECIES: flagellar biosynthesis protein FlhF [Dethiosulfovibrio]|uniref:Flagellar biosynthesis protein FlhF n=2 Tax=Dethiosulfovibrio TaxID=47054 RepID=A0ABS9EK95_9BACT|nr:MULTISPECIES: flagellar biosynthesis protein FlhF [Dethiosulfovibrio]MCF4113974.1 flagellar biosynthesis protein FlhF [Dethiosulfovibrio russensis]MCF4141613.1 flagellar biosynthesis protein FlhF [Dethiosulfovibrio marinus]MCF4143970.1 flagellar biosynthesis protein FlhF [Dethiosulfovibrio acidaminovorans]
MRVVQQITFEAKDDAEAIRIAADRLGRDAVVLSTRPVNKGGFLGLFGKPALVVTAGILEEDEPKKKEEPIGDRVRAFQQLLEGKRDSFPVVPPEGRPSGKKETDESSVGESEDRLELSSSVATASRPSISREKVAQAYGKDPNPVEERENKNLSDDVERIQRTLSSVLERLDRASVSDDGTEKPPEPRLAPSSRDDCRERWRHMLLEIDMTESFVDTLLERYGGSLDDRSFVGWLKDSIRAPFRDVISALGGSRVMFIGPTGVGKTTTIAKLAAANSLWEDRKVLLATADTYRIAAVEQLRTYAKILGVPVEVVFDPQDLKGIREKRDVELILLDTAGRSQRDSRRLDEAKELYEAFAPESVHLVISASSKYRDMLDVIERMGNMPISHLIFTKLDETLTLGPVLEIALNFDIPISFLTVGQNVPNDIEVASPDRLVNMALGGGYGD